MRYIALFSLVLAVSFVRTAEAQSNIDPTHKHAWGENVGWVNFDGGAMATPAQPARIECPDPPTEPSSRLRGYAWGENVGWINVTETATNRENDRSSGWRMAGPSAIISNYKSRWSA